MEQRCVAINLDGQGATYAQDWLDAHPNAVVISQSVYNEQMYIIYTTPV